MKTFCYDVSLKAAELKRFENFHAVAKFKEKTSNEENMNAYASGLVIYF